MGMVDSIGLKSKYLAPRIKAVVRVALQVKVVPHRSIRIFYRLQLSWIPSLIERWRISAPKVRYGRDREGQKDHGVPGLPFAAPPLWSQRNLGAAHRKKQCDTAKRGHFTVKFQPNRRAQHPEKCIPHVQQPTAVP